MFTMENFKHIPNERIVEMPVYSTQLQELLPCLVWCSWLESHPIFQSSDCQPVVREVQKVGDLCSRGWFPVRVHTQVEGSIPGDVWRQPMDVFFLTHTFLSPFLLLLLFLNCFRERKRESKGRERDKQKEKNINLLFYLLRIHWLIPCMCPDWSLNPQPWHIRRTH